MLNNAANCFDVGSDSVGYCTIIIVSNIDYDYHMNYDMRKVIFLYFYILNI